MSRGQRPDDLGSSPPWLRLAERFVTVEVTARPGSPRRGILRTGEQGLVIGLGSAAEKGKANEELVQFVAELAGVPRTAVSIVRGAGARRKVLRIAVADNVSAAKRILEASSARG